jgi:hypothetical protein
MVRRLVAFTIIIYGEIPSVPEDQGDVLPAVFVDDRKLFLLRRFVLFFSDGGPLFLFLFWCFGLFFLLLFYGFFFLLLFNLFFCFLFLLFTLYLFNLVFQLFLLLFYFFYLFLQLLFFALCLLLIGLVIFDIFFIGKIIPVRFLYLRVAAFIFLSISIRLSVHGQVKNKRHADAYD